MNMMRRLKSIASGRTSMSSEPSFGHCMKPFEQSKDGDSNSKRPKFDLETERYENTEPMPVDKSESGLERHVGSTSKEIDQLPKEMHDMKIRDEKTHTDDDKKKTYARDERDTEPAIVSGNGTETGQIIATTVGGRNGQPKQTISYMAERVVGTGSFGVVFQAKCLETGEMVAIKKVLQDKRYKNRELQIMRLLEHSNVLQLKHCFYSTTDKDEVYLNLVLEYISETVYRVLKHYSRMNQHMPMIYVQLYTYQICRALNYLHNVIGVCHRDIKPQNLLVNPHTHQLKICDFGSAKKLLPGEPNISYICSRYYRAPELIFGATEYTTAIDMWSAGCVLAELLLGQIFHKKMPQEALDLVSRLLQYSPNLRYSALEACAHPFFDDLRDPNACLPNGRAFPPLFNFTAQELDGASPELRQCLIPEHVRRKQLDLRLLAGGTSGEFVVDLQMGISRPTQGS
ncbi:hypothetical protein ACFE04_026625 [Oxalis oulophora]